MQHEFSWIKEGRPARVYFAGKVSHHGGYRGKLLGDSRVMSRGEHQATIQGKPVIYTGPFALSCDHGCWHRLDHGLISPYASSGGPQLNEYEETACPEDDHKGNGFDQATAVSNCFSQIAKSDAIHAFIDSLDCYGTIAELGYASGIGLPIFLVCSGVADPDLDVRDDLWFIKNMPTVERITTGVETTIHPILLGVSGELEPPYPRAQIFDMLPSNGQLQAKLESACHVSPEEIAEMKAEHQSVDIPTVALTPQQLDLKNSVDVCHTWIHRAAGAINKGDEATAKHWLETVYLRLSQIADSSSTAA